MKRYSLIRYSIPGADLHESPDGDICMYADAQAEIADLKQQLATACVLATTSAEQAHYFAVALDEAKGVPAGYWREMTADEAAQLGIDAQKPGVET